MKNIRITVLTLLALVASASAYAKIAVVDSQYIFENAKLTKQVNEKMKELTKKAQAKVKAKEDVLAKKQDDLIAKKGVLSSEVYSKKEAELKQEIIAFRKELNKMQRELSIKNKQELQNVMAKISKIVNNLAKKDGYDIVASKGVLMYSSDKVEITKKVLKILNSSTK